MTDIEIIQKTLSGAALSIQKIIGQKVEVSYRVVGNINIVTEKIINVVLQCTGFTMPEIKSKDRHEDLVRARQLMCYFLRICTPLYFSKIGHIIRRDHTTVMHSVQTIKDLIDTEYTDVTLLVEKIQNQLSNEIKADE